jgi:hypothetical protein
MADTHPLRIQIEEVEREIRMRRSVYPRQVAKGKLRQGEADELIKRMESVLATLRWAKDQLNV